MPYISSPTDSARLFYADYAARRNVGTDSASNDCRFNPPTPLTSTPAPCALKDLASQQLTLLFIHGWPMSHEMFVHLMLPLAHEYGIRCVAPDRRGFGRSEWAGDGDGGSSVEIVYETFAKDTLAVIQHAGVGKQGRPWVVVAASMVSLSIVLILTVFAHNIDAKHEHSAD
jgi:non-heme chloroperoxidase